MRRLADPDTRARMGDNARALAERAFSLAAMGDALMQLYERTARRS
jgi:glycosyltransferase involved in cell wall biosynthesis